MVSSSNLKTIIIMNVIINDKACTASVGQDLGRVARLSHSHVGYICGGHGVCQACYVTVQEGADCLSAPSDVEKAFLSERQIQKGGRLACQATIEKDGTVRLLSRPEEVKRMLFGNPFALFAYGAEMGQDVAGRLVPGVSNLAGRAWHGELTGRNASSDVFEALGAAVQLVIETAPDMIPFREQIMNCLGMIPAALSSCKLPFELPSLSLPFTLPFLPAPAVSESRPEIVAVKISPPSAPRPMDAVSTANPAAKPVVTLAAAPVASTPPKPAVNPAAKPSGNPAAARPWVKPGGGKQGGRP